MEDVNVKDLVKFFILCVGILYLAVVFSYLMALVFFLKFEVFDFDWKNAFSDAFGKGISGGLILGFGIWVKDKLQD